MPEDLQQKELARAGLVLRLPKCTLMELRRSDQAPADILACCSALEAFPALPEVECIKVLGAQVRSQGERSAELPQVLRKAWAAYHSRKRTWATPGSFAPNMCGFNTSQRTRALPRRRARGAGARERCLARDRGGVLGDGRPFGRGSVSGPMAGGVV